MATTLKCPACNADLETYNGSDYRLHQKTPLHSDADAVPAAPREVNGQPALVSAWAGKCDACGQELGFVEFIVHPGLTDDLYDFLACTAANFGPAREIVYEGPAPWLLWEAKVAQGTVFRHEFGPFLNNQPDSVFGNNGVSACKGGEFWRFSAKLAWRVVQHVADASPLHDKREDKQ
ncbi:hypothetical protein JWH16_04425 [Xanthomonas campestris pv. campestris]|uniref:hypothetical protein n=1 Tax=Xanthomonas campestris TaxID=339 RepID=UPI001E572B51|nr:hypothetical protein [Xanthomonas campestris]MCD0253100.1 hypothetical protein [Xanthomonas campestris pv. campestris]